MASIFSTYSTGENRVTTSFLAVLRALALDRMQCLLGSLMEQSPSSGRFLCAGTSSLTHPLDKGLPMTTLKLDGTLYHKGIAGDPIVLLSIFDEGPLEDWCKANLIFTQIMKHKDPKSGNERMAIYVTEGAISGFKDGEQVSITVDVRPDKRGNGIGVVSVNRLRK